MLRRPTEIQELTLILAWFCHSWVKCIHIEIIIMQGVLYGKGYEVVGDCVSVYYKQLFLVTQR